MRPSNDDPRRDTLAVRRAQSKRVHAGRRFEESLERTHANYLAIGAGKIVPHYPRTVTLKGVLKYARGGAPVDFSGVVEIARRPARHAYAPGIIVNNAHQDTRAVAFDAKVLREGRASYTHDPDRLHQLTELIDFTRNGALAFLLLQERERNVAIALYGLRVLMHLKARPKVPVVLRIGESLCWPAVGYTLRGYDWLALVPAMLATPDPGFSVLAAER